MDGVPEMRKKRASLRLLFILCFVLSTLSFPLVYATEDFWVKMSDVPIEISGARAAVVNGKIYVIGNSFNYEYDPETDTWTSKTPMPTGRSGFAVAVYQNKVYVIGGSRAFLEGDFGANEVYDPETDTWEQKTPNPTERSSFQANVVDGKIYLIGGAIPGGANFYTHAVALNEVYDPATDSWSNMEPMPTAVKHYASAVLDDKIYIMGGQIGDYPIPNGTLNLVQVFDPKTNQWSLPARMPINVKYAAGVATTGKYAPKRIYVFGGDANNEAYQNASRYYMYDVDPTNATQVYDPLTDNWSFAASMFSARYNLVAANVNDTLYAIGGQILDNSNYPETTYANDKYTPMGYIPEFPSWTPLLITLIAVMAVAVVYRRRLDKLNQGRVDK
jgi:N-acetylneuraminic acid mutarotase